MARKINALSTASTPPSAGQSSTLGRQLMITLQGVTQLLGDTSDPDQVATLSDQRGDLLRTIADLVEVNVTAASAEYKTATASLQDASDAINSALKGMQSVAKAIAFIAKALDLVSKLIP